MDELERFVRTQQHSYAQALDEIRAGRKRGHWIWFVFPQLKGLGYSDMSMFYGIADADEARHYLAHPLLGARLREITAALLETGMDDPIALMGRPDDLKLCSCMTLFEAVSHEPLFTQVLERFYHGKRDGRTLQMLGINEK